MGDPSADMPTPAGDALVYTVDADAPTGPTAVRPITIAVPDAVLDDLQYRLANARLVMRGVRSARIRGSRW
jgi:hypothetical protein